MIQQCLNQVQGGKGCNCGVFYWGWDGQLGLLCHLLYGYMLGD